MATSALARAKINLALHVTGQRGDGYHLLDSLVVFADLGDLIRCAPADRLGLTITGPMAADLPLTADNLVLRAARLLDASKGAAITLEKHLPVASGIGGGSADAAATLHALCALWHLPLPAPATVLALGSDVPVCLAGKAARMQGVGDLVTPLSQALPKAWLVLANPRQAVVTSAVFNSLQRRDNAPLPRELPRLHGLAGLAAFLRRTRNDLEPAAVGLAPVIAEVKAALSAQSGCLIARMSGSGATCFGLFADAAQAAAAARSVQQTHPGWWVAAAAMLS